MLCTPAQEQCITNPALDFSNSILRAQWRNQRKDICTDNLRLSNIRTQPNWCDQKVKEQYHPKRTDKLVKQITCVWCLHCHQALQVTGIQWQSSLSVLTCHVLRLLSLLIAHLTAVCHFCYIKQLFLATTTIFSWSKMHSGSHHTTVQRAACC